jgi:hypothetical protein
MNPYSEATVEARAILPAKATYPVGRESVTTMISFAPRRREFLRSKRGLLGEVRI